MLRSLQSLSKLAHCLHWTTWGWVRTFRMNSKTRLCHRNQIYGTSLLSPWTKLCSADFSLDPIYGTFLQNLLFNTFSGPEETFPTPLSKQFTSKAHFFGLSDKTFISFAASFSSPKRYSYSLIDQALDMDASQSKILVWYQLSTPFNMSISLTKSFSSKIPISPFAKTTECLRPEVIVQPHGAFRRTFADVSFLRGQKWLELVFRWNHLVKMITFLTIYYVYIHVHCIIYLCCNVAKKACCIKVYENFLILIGFIQCRYDQDKVLKPKNLGLRGD